MAMERILTIGARLAEERKRLGHSQTTLGTSAGVSKVTQFKYERDETSPTADYLARAGEMGVDVLYVVTGRRGKPLMTRTLPPSDPLLKALEPRGFTWVETPAGASEIHITPVGLSWLLNLRLQVGAPRRWRWGPDLLDAVAEAYPSEMRELNVQVVTLLPYGTKKYSALCFYLDSTPPSIPYCISPVAALTGRVELDSVVSTLPLDVPGDAVGPTPVLVLTDEELERLRAGEICRYSVD